MILIILFGFLIGPYLAIAQVNKNAAIAGMSTLENFRETKTMNTGVEIGVILISLLGLSAWTNYYAEPLILGGIFWAGLLFGPVIAIYSFCSGILSVSVRQGSVGSINPSSSYLLEPII
ncbi:hypothetical protein ACFOSV_16775 [Algoriphagus namhaensis]|uniref:Uncharacterized protein n=1 Tax=Algoriphagus namhaensis TaxID=915353 RepID=A0ABV8AV23_9BACT